jgi:hypothetical protein
MKFKLSEEFKKKVMFEVRAELINYMHTAPIDDLMKRAKNLVYGYAKTLAAEEMERTKWNKENNVFTIDEFPFIYVPAPVPPVPLPNVTYTPNYTTITVGGTTDSQTATPYQYPTTSTYFTSNTNGSSSTYTYSISTISNRIASKVKEYYKGTS